jgi:hypothetical protein
MRLKKAGSAVCLRILAASRLGAAVLTPLNRFQFVKNFAMEIWQKHPGGI